MTTFQAIRREFRCGKCASRTPRIYGGIPDGESFLDLCECCLLEASVKLTIRWVEWPREVQELLEEMDRWKPEGGPK